MREDIAEFVKNHFRFNITWFCQCTCKCEMSTISWFHKNEDFDFTKMIARFLKFLKFVFISALYYGKSQQIWPKNIFDFSRPFKGNCTHDIMKWPDVENTKGQILKLTLGFIKCCLLRLLKKMGLCCRFCWMKCQSAAERYPE